MNDSQHRAAHGQRSSLVEHNHVEMREAFEGLAALEEYSKLCATAHGHGERGGHSQAHGARAGDDQHGDGRGEGHFQRVRGDKPNEKGERGQSQHDGNEDRAGAVGQPLHRRARALRLGNHARDLRQHRRLAQRLGAAGDSAFVVERTGQHASAH